MFSRSAIHSLTLYLLGHAYRITAAEELKENGLRSTAPAVEALVSFLDPHHVLVVYGHHFCSGTCIGSKIVLTVASCFNKDTDENSIFVKFGCKNFLDDGQIISVVEKKQHEYFQYRSAADNDIALLLLKTHVHFDETVRKILLVEQDSVLPAKSVITVTGWGAKNPAKNQERYIRRLRMMLLDDTECLKAYANSFTPSLFCAKYDKKNGLDDNGGAAVHKGLVVGITSYGGSDDQKHIALFTNISYFYKWIKLNTERLLMKHCSDEDDY